ncbi:MAG: sulfite dehydrogenase [Dehalococcoidia bacterium]|nr:sulfite dehydrogenase [Dehalococcoidia bacterium]
MAAAHRPDPERYAPPHIEAARTGSDLRRGLSRRGFLASAAAAGGAYFLGRLAPASAQTPTLSDADIVVPDDPTSILGMSLSQRGLRSPFVHAQRLINDPDAPLGVAGWTFSPLQDLEGIVTPSDLHFERHHAGVAMIDPTEHRLVVHGMVDQAKQYTLWDLERMPQESHIYFVECSGNSLAGYPGGAADDTAQSIHGLVSTSEWVGVPMREIIEDVGLDPSSTWALFEGADAAVMTRSVPVEKLIDDAFIALYQNGEPIRPAQGYPMRLVLPGWEGNMQIKWLRRIEFGDAPFQTKEETRHYTDRLPDGRARQFTYAMEAKSVITRPSPGRGLAGAGQWTISGIAWSGRGRIERVEVSTDDGNTWEDATLLGENLPRSTVRFHYPWEWDGEEAVLMSRATDETGYVQPTREALLDVRGEGYTYHYNGIQTWRLHSDGTLSNGYVDA